MKVALVTGISSGIGRATAVRLTEVGFTTFGTVRSDAAPPDGVETVHLDVRDPVSVHAGIQSVLARAGRIDVLVNSAGVAMISSGEETGVEEARQLFETNFFGVMRMTQAVLPAMRAQRSGRIVNISSILGFLPAPFMSVYAATKHAVEGYSESLDHEVRRFGVRVITVEPGLTRTALGIHSRAAERPIEVYDSDRDLVSVRMREIIEHGADPAGVAGVIADAVSVPVPSLHYPAGPGARRLRILRSIAPPSMVDRGIRKQFGLGAAS